MKKILSVLLAVIVLATFAFFAVGSSDDTPNTNDKPAENKTENVEDDIWTKAGTYKVGADIPAGEYIVVANGYCYIEVTKDSTGSFDSIVSNDNISTRTYITLYDGQYFKVSDGKFAPEADIAPYEATNGKYVQGTYKVGKDIPAGEYKIVANDSYCYIEVCKNSNNTFDSIVTNENIELGESTYVTVANGQYLTFTGGEITIS